MTETTPLAFYPTHRPDSKRVRRNWQRAAASMAAEEGLLRRLDQALLERLEDIRLQPQRVLELGGRTGALATALQKKWPKAEIVSLSLAGVRRRNNGWRLPWQRQPLLLEGEACRLPFARNQFDLVISSMALHWSGDLPSSLREMRRVLAPDRLLLFTVAGSATLAELFHVLALQEGKERTLLLPSLSGLGDLLTSGGYIMPVVDREQAVIPVPDLRTLWQQLRMLGSAAPTAAPENGLRGKGHLKRLEQTYRQECALPDGQLACTVEVLFGHAWKKDPGAKG
ncbi:MAG: methyltransferase domain-containing protein [Magnetococcales bacterium]|nr:methyltransferase domain-containing protein [Magnetococcales bacterium]MBF0114751.1 methyltransferase domain-containing protein [Magnetococcales bacterium]